VIWLINFAGLALIGLIVWWFWLYRPAALLANPLPTDSEKRTILVEGGVYLPARIQLPAGQPVTLQFLRKDPSPCAEMVLFDGLNLSQELPVNQVVDIVLPALAPGRYPFTCQMQMYRGELEVVAKEEKPAET